ncbi:hypothetical protein XELAEV_18046268mg [Xenopus laevis]|uniref:Uncharacterized protein n=1 Tax=Xenopus laevis TaxID=8355 RepID=A0A974BT82_XENLA|nr:hypothetical protein XELAEV_18046268mg [Xenopus laevis]
MRLQPPLHFNGKHETVLVLFTQKCGQRVVGCKKNILFLNGINHNLLQSRTTQLWISGKQPILEEAAWQLPSPIGDILLVKPMNRL